MDDLQGFAEYYVFLLHSRSVYHYQFMAKLFITVQFLSFVLCSFIAIDMFWQNVIHSYRFRGRGGAGFVSAGRPWPRALDV